ncbi:YcjF family protein [Lactococcus termiticola]|uniref:GTPase n=1 Tax=Lactococcus termiticola TaxID=2169526 RepID=A0A2R5HFQ5_9LACT|nr:DUF697 domain-containing protein [Lactococcus termiticola]GBG96889.1 hypothetical protein NtB2_01024 [Lactococcus termiticola]
MKKQEKLDLDLFETKEEEADFRAFFDDVLKKIPKKYAVIVKNSLAKTSKQAEAFVKSRAEQFDKIFDDFLKDLDRDSRKKAHKIIHFASVTAAIVGFTPLPFADALLLVPIQLVMMTRLYAIFGESWSEGLTKSLAKEMVVVGLGRSAVGNLLKFIPAVGTIAGGVINASVASIITESLGWVTVKMLHDGEDIFDQIMSFRGQFNLLFSSLSKASKSKNKK